MAKTKTPFLSLDSSGSIGNALTSQKRGGLTILREKPTPAFRYTLPQAYIRWLYQDYAYLWTLQSAATKATYRATGVRFHLTGFQYWMKYNLATLPDIAAWWRFDTLSAGLALDSSHNANHATNFGARLAPGFIGRAFNLDGINDYLNVAPSASLRPPSEFTLTGLFKSPTYAPETSFLSIHIPGTATAGILFRTFNNGLDFFVVNAGGIVGLTSATTLVNDTLYAFACRLRNNRMNIFLNEAKDTNTTTFTPPIVYDLAEPIWIGTWTPGGWWKGELDNLVFYNTGLDDTLILNILKRRFPI